MKQSSSPKTPPVADVDERMIPAKHKGSGIYGEHIIRYEAAEDLVRDKKVLDIASGSGYGTALLARTAKSVAGVDVAAEAIKYAEKHFSGPNITYKKGDGKKIPYPDATFDVVVSFETIEHLDDYETFMDEIKRVLKTDGLLVLSTPNDKEFAEGNHFHLHQFDHNELLKLAERYYSNVEQYYQATWIGNMLGTYDDMTTEWEAKVPMQQLAPIPADKFLYFYFLCSNRPVKEKVKLKGAFSQHWSDRAVVKKNKLTQDHINNLEAMIEGLKGQEEILRAQAKQADKARALAQAELQRVYDSRRWKMASRFANLAKKLRD